MKRRAIFVSFVAAVLIISTSARYMKSLYKNSYQKNQAIIPIDNNLTVITGGGGNSGILVTEKGVIVIDTKMANDASTLFQLAKEKAGNKKIIVINTHYHMDHTGGNNLYKGDKIYIGNYDKDFLQKQLKPEDMPTDYIKNNVVMDMGDENVELYNLGQAHTFNDVVVYLKNRKIMFSGDLVFDKVNPVLKRESGADVNKWIAVLKLMLKKWDIKTIVPGHGPTGGIEIAQNLIDYFKDMKSAAASPDKAKDIVAKYAEWKAYPDMCSSEITIQYIKESK
jgi:cyclase